MSDNILDLVRKYEVARESNKSLYLDADEFDALAEYFDSNAKIDEARDVIASGLKIHPQSSSLLIKKARFAMYDGNYGEAMKLLNNITGYEYELHMVRIECLLNLGLNAEAISLTQEVLEQEDSDLETVYADLGYAYLEGEMYREAILYFKKSLEYESDNLEVLSELSYAYETVGDFENAITTSNKLLDIDSYNYETWVNLGKLHTLREEYDKAVDAFDFALTIESEDVNILKLKGHCLSLLGRAEEAIEVFDSILIENPGDASLYFLLSECYQSIDMLEKALEMTEKYKIEYEDSGVEYVAKKAQILLQMERANEAQAFINEQLAGEPDSVELRVISAEIKIQLEQFEEAEQILMEVYDENQDDFYLVNMLSILCIRKEDYEKAVEYTELLLDIDGDNIDTRQRLAMLYIEMGEKEYFDNLLDEFTDAELMELFKFVYVPKHEELFNREQLIFYLNEAREQRILFKNLKY